MTLLSKLSALTGRLFGRNKDDWTLCGHCYGDHRMICIQLGKCRNRELLVSLTKDIEAKGIDNV